MQLSTFSSEKYQRLENEKRNARVVRKTNVGPVVKYQSFSMPVIVLSSSNNSKDPEKQADENGISYPTEITVDNRYTLIFYLYTNIQMYFYFFLKTIIVVGNSNSLVVKQQGKQVKR